MNYTTNYNLKKPEETDFYDIGDFNDNTDDLDNILNQLNADKADRVDVHPLINIWDEQWLTGSFDEYGRPVSTDQKIRSKNYISVKPSTVYRGVWSNGLNIYFYDVNKAFISVYGQVVGTTFTTPSNCYYIMFSTYGGGTSTYNNDISINYPSTYTGYYPSALPRTNAHVGGLGNAIGMRGWNQVLSISTTASATVNGVTITNNGDGSFTLNGTATSDAWYYYNSNVPVVAGHKYINGNSCSEPNKVWSGSAVQSILSRESKTAIVVGGQTTTTTFTLWTRSGTTFNNVRIYTMLIDLTALFGAGNEPSSVADFRAMFPADYYPYCQGGFADLLWENASETTVFSPQTISLDLNNYRFVVIRVKEKKSAFINSAFLLAKSSYMQYFCFATSQNSYRQISSVTNSGITFVDAFRQTGFGTTVDDNDYCIPLMIYGVR